MSKIGYLGIDVSKGYSDFLILNSSKEVVEPPFRLYDVVEGQQQLGKILDGLFRKGFEQIYCGVESTGGYENNWVNYLQELGKTKAVQIARINPKGVKSLGEAALTRTITDSVSAQNIAFYLIDFHHKIHYLQSSQGTKLYLDGRKHNSFIRMLKKQKNQLGNQLEKILYQELSVLMCYCRHGFPLWLLRLLEKYPGVELMKKAGEKKLSKIKGISNEKAIALIKKLSSLDNPTSNHISSIIKGTVRQILQLDELIDEQKADLLGRFKNEPDVILLTSITGVGEQSAVEILIEIEDVNRFEAAKSLIAYFGTHPMWKQSGDGTWGNHMSKKGRSEIRGVLYMCCMTAIRYDEMFKSKYAAARAQGKNHYSAMGVVMNKMLRIIFGVLKTKTKYNIEVDHKNQQNAKAKQKQKEQMQAEEKKEKSTKLERYNDTVQENLPVSNRHAKRKRQGPKLQNEVCTGSPAPSKTNI
jgi:transposase